MSCLRVIVCLTTENGTSRLKSPLPSREKSRSVSRDVAQPCDMRSSTTACIRYIRPYYFEISCSVSRNLFLGGHLNAVFLCITILYARVQSGEEDSDIICPGSPLSQSSRISRQSVSPRLLIGGDIWVRLVFSWLMSPWVFFWAFHKIFLIWFLVEILKLLLKPETTNIQQCILLRG